MNNHRSLYQSLDEAIQQTATISCNRRYLFRYLSSWLRSAEKCIILYYAFAHDVVIAVLGNAPKRANTRASQLEELALDCRTKEAYNLGTFAHHSMMYSETTRDETVTGWKEHEKEGAWGGGMLLPVYIVPWCSMLRV